MLSFLFVITELINLSFALNALNCNGVAFTYDGITYAAPVAACRGDNYNYNNYSFIYYCNGGSIYRKIWQHNSRCIGTADVDQKWTDIVAADTKFSTTYIEQCDLTQCEYVKMRTYKPKQQISNCSQWTHTPSDSYFLDAAHIRNYCFDFGTYSEQWACIAVKKGAAEQGGVAKYTYNGVTDCSGTSNTAFSSTVGENLCIVYQDNQGPYYEKQDISCNPTTPQWTQPITELPCNAVEFEFDGATVTYPVDVCVQDKISKKSLWFYCNGTTLQYESWDNDIDCEGDADDGGTSFEEYMNHQSIATQALFGIYSIECDKSDCEYVVLKDYTYTGECDEFTPIDTTDYTETYFLRDYCLKIDDGTDKGSVAWGCDLENGPNGYGVWLQYDDVTDCSDSSKARLSWVDLEEDTCLSGSDGIDYVDVTCFTHPTNEPTVSPTVNPTVKPTSKPTVSPSDDADEAWELSMKGYIFILMFLIYFVCQ